MIAHRAGRPAEQGGDFGAGLRKPENVVDEEQHILVFFVPEVFCDRQARQGDTEAGPGRFVHLAIDQGDFGRAQVILLDDAGLGHLVIKIVAFAAAFADAGEN